MFRIPSFIFLFLISLALVSNGCKPGFLSGYEVRDDSVIFHSGMKGLGTMSKKKVEGADPKSFVVVSGEYGRDKKNAYFLGERIGKSHGPTFELLEGPYSKDQSRAYHRGVAISEKGSRFEVLYTVKGFSGDSYFATDTAKIYKNSKEFLPERVDAASFERIGKSKFFKDKQYVYTLARVVDGADPATFDVRSRFNGKYASDKEHVFYNGKIVEGADVATHKIIDEIHHSDQDNIYFATSVLSNDPANFSLVSNSYSKDSTSVYWRSRKISDDPENFVAFPSERGGSYAKDSKRAFWAWKEMDDVDVATFKGLNQYYAKDKKRVFFAVNTVNMPRILDGADAESFALVKGEDGVDARDKHGVFKFGSRRKNKSSRSTK